MEYNNTMLDVFETFVWGVVNGGDVAFAGVSERRKSQRFDLTLPIHVVRLSEKSVSLVGRTRDVSSGGAYFVVNADLDEGTPIEFFVTLQGGISSVVQGPAALLGPGHPGREEWVRKDTWGLPPRLIAISSCANH